MTGLTIVDQATYAICLIFHGKGKTVWLRGLVQRAKDHKRLKGCEVERLKVTPR